MCNPFRKWYDELQRPTSAQETKLGEWGEREQDRREVACIASGVEIFMFYLSIFVWIAFVFLILKCPMFVFRWRYLTALIPLFMWMFLRSSRKDMQATGNLVAGTFGALGGAIIVILAQYLKSK